MDDKWLALKIKPEQVWSSKFSVPESLQGQKIGQYAWPKSELLLAEKIASKRGNTYYRLIIADNSWTTKHLDEMLSYLRQNGYTVTHVVEPWTDVEDGIILYRYLIQIVKN